MVSRILEPYLVMLNSLPKSAMAPLLIVWLGANLKTIVVAAVSVAVFGSVMTLYTSFTQTDRELIRLIRSLGGGSKTAVWSQIKADINPVTLETVKSVEAASLGAAILAGTATGIFDSVENAVDRMVEVKDRTLPSQDSRQVYEEGYQMYQRLFKDLTECFEKAK